MKVMNPPCSALKPSDWFAPILFVGAVISSLFFQGERIEFYAIAQIAVTLLAVAVLSPLYGQGLTIPKTKLALSLTLFWLWLSVTPLWTQVPAVGALNFWWLGCLPLTFWIYTLLSDKKDWFPGTALLILVIGLAVALTACYQLLILGKNPLSVFININSQAAFLNLIALPLTGYLLIVVWQQPKNRLLTLSLGIALFVLVYAVAITKGRAATVSYFIGLGLLLFAAARVLPRKLLFIPIVITVSAFLVAHVTQEGGILNRFTTLSAPMTAGVTRLVIWQAVWEMIKQAPWWGIGLGVLGYAYPAYRDPSDSSAGYYAHNDYLQLWLEAGVPGLILFLLIWFSAADLFLRSLQDKSVTTSKIEMAGLVSGMAAIGFHSLFDFNFYQIPILCIAGLMLARIQAIAMQFQKIGVWVLKPATWFSKGTYQLIVILVALFPILYFVSLGLGAHEYKAALARSDNSDIAGTQESLERAHRLFPANDSVLMSHADLYRTILLSANNLDPTQRALLFSQALLLLREAERLNPLRPQTFVVRAQLYEGNPSLFGPNWTEQTAAAYRRALSINPRFYEARYKYAEFLLKQNKLQEASGVLEAGMNQAYLLSDHILLYYALTAKLRSQTGEREKGRQLEKKIEGILLANGWTRVPAKAAPKSNISR
jgi:O-antigen ligase